MEITISRYYDNTWAAVQNANCFFLMSPIFRLIFNCHKQKLTEKRK